MSRDARRRQRELEEARATVAALVSGQVDAVAGPSGALLLAAAEALRGAEERYRVLLDSAPDAMVVFNDRGEIQMLNGRTQTLFGHPAEELVGRSVEVLMPDRLWAAYADERDVYFHNPCPVTLGVEERMHCKRADGGEFPAEICLSPAQTSEGTYIIAAVRDVTGRVEIEDALRESEARLASTLNSIGDGVLATDLNGAVIRINPVAEQLTGFERAEAIGQRVDRIYRVLSEKDRQPMATPVEALAAGGATVAPTARLVARDGRERLISQSAAAIRKPTGEVVGVVVAFHDVTAQKELQDQLLLSDRMVSLGTLAAGVAHEINNPLAALIGNLDILGAELERTGQDLKLPGVAHDVLRDIREAAERVRLIVKDLKLFSRSNEDTAGALDVQRLLDSSVRLAWNEVRHRARLTRDFQTVPHVMANEARLGEVFVNLIVNAAQAIPEGHADENEIRLVTRVDDRGRVAIEVRDTGGGIPAEIRKRIFDPFFTTKPVGVGTGLGLAICHRIITELGGEITVESVRGHGTAFCVSLPAAPHDVAVPDITPSPLVPRQRRGRVLIIDDEALVRGFMRRALAGGHEVVVEACGEDGLTRVQRGERFDVILCDVMMPQMTGVDFYEALAAAAPEQAARVVFITGGAFTGRTQRALEKIGNARLDKPFRADALRVLVDDLVAGPAGREDSGPVSTATAGAATPGAPGDLEHHA